MQLGKGKRRQIRSDTYSQYIHEYMYWDSHLELYFDNYDVIGLRERAALESCLRTDFMN